MAKSLSALLQQSTIDDHEEILKACNATLKQAKEDVNAQHARFIALLKLDRYGDALRTLEEAGDKLKQRVGLERAYALYRSGDLQEAVEASRALHGERGARHVEAQASYRLEDFTTAANTYKALTSRDRGTIEGDSDIRINSSANTAQLSWCGQGSTGQKTRHSREDLEAFETAYNAGCVAVARGELREGEFLLKTAKDLCEANTELSESDKVAEILPIKVQQLYLLHHLGKSKEAEALASEITVQQIPDAATRQIAQNNLQAVSTNVGNPYASHRLVKDAGTPSKADRLFDFQSQLVESNGMVLDLLSYKSNAVLKHTERVIAEDSPSLSTQTNSFSVLNAAAHGQSQLAKLGLKQILPLFTKRPTDIGLAMTIIQLYMLTSNPGAATTVLEKLLSNISSSDKPMNRDHILNAPGLVALQVSLYGLQNRTSQAKAVLAKASSYWRHRSKTFPKDNMQPIPLFHAAGITLLSSNNPEYQSETREIFSKLHSQSPNAPFAKAGFIASHALTSLAQVSQLANTLPSVSSLISGLDVDALEAAGVASRRTISSSETSNMNRKRALDRNNDKEKSKSTPQQPPKKKRVRKSYLPKDFDPAKKPDPERWLPMRDRSYYRPKGKKGRKKADDKTQGGSVTTAGGNKAGDAGGSGIEGADVSGKASAGPIVASTGGGGKAKGKKKPGRK